MRAPTTGVLALVAAGMLAGPVAAADPAGRFTLVELDVAGRVVEVSPGDGVAVVRTDAAGSAGYHFVRIAAGDIEVEMAGIVVTMLDDPPANLLPQSRMAIGDGVIHEVWLSDATGRYRHGVLGDRLEAATLSVRLRDGTLATLDAGDDAVFEDLRPRLADLDGDGSDEVIVVKSYLDRGAAVAVVGWGADGLSILAETPPIGRPSRWLNPIGAADFDGDGAVEIAYVETPHIGGRLMLWQWRDGALTRGQSEFGFSNHAIGSTELGLSAIADLDGDGVPDMAVPGRYRQRLRLVTFAGGAFRELADLPVGGTIATAIAPIGGALVFGLDDGRLLALRY